MNINLTLFAQALAFAGLIWIIATKIWPPLLAAIEERQQKIAEGLAAADRSQKDLAQAQEKVNEALKEARVKANEIISQAHARANQIGDPAQTQANPTTNQHTGAAQAEIACATPRSMPSGTMTRPYSSMPCSTSATGVRKLSMRISGRGIATPAATVAAVGRAARQASHESASQQAPVVKYKGKSGIS